MAEQHIIRQHRYYWDDADHLIKLAREYESQADEKDHKSDYYIFWQFRLARMSFIARMMSIEAMLNNILEQFCIYDKFKELDKLEDKFPRNERFPRIRRKRRGRPFQVPLKWKLYLTPYLCNENSRFLKDEYFAYEAGAYRKFRQLIMIRNEFVHTRLSDRDFSIHMGPEMESMTKGDLGKLLISSDYTDCCEDMGITKDPVCFKIDNARVCGSAMREVVLELNYFLDGRILTKDFWESEENNGLA